MTSFAGKLAGVTGGGSGIGRALVRQPAAAGCAVAACDWDLDAIAQTAVSAQSDAADGVLVSGHGCDMSDEVQVNRFREALSQRHAAGHVDLVFSTPTRPTA